jgi:hypothetical protein
MDGVTLVHRARDAGLRLEVAGNALKITGPREAEPFVRLLAKHKTQVLDALRKVQEVRKVPRAEHGDAIHHDCPYASALAALPAQCPAYVSEDRWRQAITDATAFATEWGPEAQALGWTEPELLGLHPVPEQPAPNYDRLARLDDIGLIWLLRSRPLVALTETTAAIQGATAVLTYRKINMPALGPVGDSLEDWGAT